MKKPISMIASKIAPSSTLAIDTLYKSMKAKGLNVMGFGIGEPDFATPEHIKDAAVAAIRANVTKYTPAAGSEELREAVCRRLHSDFGLTYKPSDILISSGAKHNIFIALMCLLNPGDEVVLPAPYWVSYYEMIRMAGGVPVIVSADETTSFKISAAELSSVVTPKTKALILNSPSNPSGMIYTKEELMALARVCVKESIYVISDDIYCNLIYDHTSYTPIASLGEDIKELTILVNGVSKSYAMTGWRIGYSAANPELAKAMSNYQSNSTSAPSSISQAAAYAALTAPQDCVEEMRRAFEKRRNLVCRTLQSIEGIQFIVPQGAFYVMINIQHFVGKTMYGQTIRDGDDFSRLLLEKGLVAMVPCSGFGAPNHIRMSYAASEADLETGLARLDRFIKDA